MSLDSVRQLQTLDSMMKEQFEAYPVSTAMVLGVAGGNGLPWALPAREGTAHLVIVPRPLARTLTSVGSDLSGRRGEPPSGAGARARGLSIRVPHVAVTSWGLPSAASSEGTDFFCP